MYLNPHEAAQCLILAFDSNKSSAFIPVGDGPRSKSASLKNRIDPKSSDYKPSSVNHKIMNYCQAGWILSAAERYPGYKHWSNYVYNEDYRNIQDGELYGKSGGWLIRALAATFAFCNKRKINKRSPLTQPLAIEDLAQHCFIDYTHGVRTNTEKYRPHDICMAIWGKRPDDVNWYRGIKQHYDYMTKILQQHDQAVIGAVADVIRMQCETRDTA